MKNVNPVDAFNELHYEVKQPATKRPRINAGVFAQVGALTSAVISSACCWLPLLLLAFGVSGSALSTTFKAWRPILLPVTFLFLGIAFFFAYRKPKKTSRKLDNGIDTTTNNACCVSQTQEPSDDNACCPPKSGTAGFLLNKFNKIMLWLVTVAVTAFAFFPNYIGLVTGDGNTFAALSDSDQLDKLVVNIEGMTCKACAIKIKKSLSSIAGISAAEVSYDQKRAIIGIPKGAGISRQAILNAISNAGDYTGRFSDQILWTLKVEGMTCESCAYGIKAKLLKIPGVFSASVSFEQALAEVIAAPDVSDKTLKKAISDAGFTVTSLKKTE